jgi:putative SOS response-associated peptidase YedK
MCGRYTFSSIEQSLIERFGLIEIPPDVKPRYNIAPGQAAAVIRNIADNEQSATAIRRMSSGLWGFKTEWQKQSLLINARSESISEKSTFSPAFASRRCLIPADGWYEWEKLTQSAPNSKTRKLSQPWFIRPKEAGSFAFAGIWTPNAKPSSGDAAGHGFRFCILTCASSSAISYIHPRMPLILNEEFWKAWLSPDYFDLALLEYPKRLPDLEFHPVSRKINSVVNDHADLCDAIIDDSAAQGELF